MSWCMSWCRRCSPTASTSCRSRSAQWQGHGAHGGFQCQRRLAGDEYPIRAIRIERNDALKGNVYAQLGPADPITFLMLKR